MNSLNPKSKHNVAKNLPTKCGLLLDNTNVSMPLGLSNDTERLYECTWLWLSLRWGHVGAWSSSFLWSRKSFGGLADLGNEASHPYQLPRTRMLLLNSKVHFTFVLANYFILGTWELLCEGLVHSFSYIEPIEVVAHGGTWFTRHRGIDCRAITKQVYPSSL